MGSSWVELKNFHLNFKILNTPIKTSKCYNQDKIQDNKKHSDPENICICYKHLKNVNL